MTLEHPEDPETPGSCLVEVALPIRVSHKWVAYACRTAGVAKPKWNPIREVWTTTLRSADGTLESIAITGNGESRIRIRVGWSSPQGATRDTPTARRIVSAIVTAMQWQVRQRAHGPASQLHLR